MRVLGHPGLRTVIVHALRMLREMRAKVAALPKLRSNHEARSNNSAI
jgi:hypothetical protein